MVFFGNTTVSSYQISEFGETSATKLKLFFPEKHHKVSLRLALSNAFKRY